MTFGDFLIYNFVFSEPHYTKCIEDCEKEVRYFLLKKYKIITKVTIRIGGIGDFYRTQLNIDAENKYINTLLKKNGKRVCLLKPI